MVLGQIICWTINMLSNLYTLLFCITTCLTSLTLKALKIPGAALHSAIKQIGCLIRCSLEDLSVFVYKFILKSICMTAGLFLNLVVKILSTSATVFSTTARWLFKNITSELIELIVCLWKIMLKAVRFSFHLVVDVVTWLVEAVMKAAEQFKQKMISAIVELIKRWEKLRDYLEYLWKRVPEILEEIIKHVYSIYNDVIDIISKSRDDIMKFARELKQMMKLAFDELMKHYKVMIDYIQDNIPAILEAISKRVDDFMVAAEELLQKMMLAFEELMKLMVFVLRGISEMATVLFSFVVKVFWLVAGELVAKMSSTFPVIQKVVLILSIYYIVVW